MHGAAVARAILRLMPEARLFGNGGPAMEKAGVATNSVLNDLAVMGGLAVLPRLPRFVALERSTRRLIQREDVSLMLLIDYPGMNLRLARWARASGRRVLYFIPPQVWAWRAARAKRLTRDCDRVLTVLPFEAPFLSTWGVNAEFVGHPLLDSFESGGLPSAAGRPSEPLVGLFPGSRVQEVRHMLPVFAEAAHRLGKRHPRIRFKIGVPDHLPRSHYLGYGIPPAPAQEVIRQSHAAITKSGTITLDLALAGVPMVVGYLMPRVEWAISRRLVKLPSIVLVNLILEETVVTELLQTALTPGRLVQALEPLLDPGSDARRRQHAGFEEVRDRLGTPGCSERVARHAVDLLS